LYENFPFQKWSLKRATLSPLLFNFALEYAIKKFQKYQMRLKLNGIYQLMAYADNVNLLGDNIYTVNKTQQL
jgi:hypothetical protein